MALLDGDRFEGKFRDGVHQVDVSDLMRRMVKENLLKFDGRPLFPERIAYTVPYKLFDAEARLYTRGHRIRPRGVQPRRGAPERQAGRYRRLRAHDPPAPPRLLARGDLPVAPTPPRAPREARARDGAAPARRRGRRPCAGHGGSGPGRRRHRGPTRSAVPHRRLEGPSASVNEAERSASASELRRKSRRELPPRGCREGGPQCRGEIRRPDLDPGLERHVRGTSQLAALSASTDHAYSPGRWTGSPGRGKLAADMRLSGSSRSRSAAEMRAAARTGSFSVLTRWSRMPKSRRRGSGEACPVDGPR